VHTCIDDVIIYKRSRLSNEIYLLTAPNAYGDTWRGLAGVCEIQTFRIPCPPFCFEWGVLNGNCFFYLYVMCPSFCVRCVFCAGWRVSKLENGLSLWMAAICLCGCRFGFLKKGPGVNVVRVGWGWFRFDMFCRFRVKRVGRSNFSLSVAAILIWMWRFGWKLFFWTLCYVPFLLCPFFFVVPYDGRPRWKMWFPCQRPPFFSVGADLGFWKKVSG
jgi:hypothetical protein